MKNILIIFDSRATFAYSNNVLQKIKKYKNIKISTLVTGNYLDKSMGVNLDLFKKFKIKITKKVKFLSSKSKRYTWPMNLGKAITSFSREIDKINPDLVLLTGDRIETFAACITSTYLNIPIAHIQAGDKSGHVDDIARAAIAKMAHIHFASCKDSADRLISWGEEKKRIFNVGAPQLDDIQFFLSKKKKIQNKKKKIIVIFHPVLGQKEKFTKYIKNLYLVLSRFNFEYYWIYPNNDYGFRVITNFLKKEKVTNKIKLIKNLDRDLFLNLMFESVAIVGNSSCGIIEAPSFKIPVLNIGDRQNLRPQASNIVNSDYSVQQITKNFSFILNNKKFLRKLKKTRNLYFKKNSSDKICKIINKLNLKDNMFKKF